MPFITHHAGELLGRLVGAAKTAPDQGQASFIHTRGSSYLIGRAATFSDGWEKNVLLDYRSR